VVWNGVRNRLFDRHGFLVNDRAVHRVGHFDLHFPLHCVWHGAVNVVRDGFVDRDFDNFLDLIRNGPVNRNLHSLFNVIRNGSLHLHFNNLIHCIRYWSVNWVRHRPVHRHVNPFLNGIRDRAVNGVGHWSINRNRYLNFTLHRVWDGSVHRHGHLPFNGVWNRPVHWYRDGGVHRHRGGVVHVIRAVDCCLGMGVVVDRDRPLDTHRHSDVSHRSLEVTCITSRHFNYWFGI